MTVPRNPVADCVLAMIGQLGEARVIEATGKSVNALHKASNPNERGRAVSLVDLIRLAAACEAHGLPHAVEDAIKAEIRMELARIGGPGAGGNPLLALCEVDATVGTLNRVVVDGVADGTIDPHERRAILGTAADVRRKLDQLEQAVTLQPRNLKTA
jgi:hypothetical protein